MKKTISFFMFLFSLMIANISHGQVGVGTLNPDISSQLDITSTTKGLLIPRVKLVQISLQNPITGTVAQSLLVYNTETINDVTPGFYYWDGSKWIKIINKNDVDKLKETITTFSNNGDGSYSYINENGTATKLDIADNIKLYQTLTSLEYDSVKQILTYRDEKDASHQLALTGLTGPIGPQGIQGIQGVAGVNGIDGAVGPQGLKGDTGDQGIQGVAGANGIDGAVGPQGLKGDTGDQGIQGVAGVNGTDGVVGAQGLKGDTGDQGIQGVAGANGTDGAVGAQGLKGDTGDQGIQGVAGVNGIDGAVGAQGLKGDTGDQGIQGVAGVNGIDGAVGPQGPKGDAGLPAPVYTAGTGIVVDNVNQIISAQNTTAIWNSNQLQGNPISTTTPTGNQVLGWSGTDWKPSNVALSEPWRVAGTDDEANSNSQDIYQTGNVAIGTKVATTYKLNVFGGNQVINGTITPTLNFLSNGATDTDANAQGTISFWEAGRENASGGGLEFISPAGTAANRLDIYGFNSSAKSTIASFDVQNARLGIGTVTPVKELSVVGDAVISKTLQIDGAANSDGSLRSGLFFGDNNSEVGISSNRTSAANGNLKGLDFWSGSNKRMSIIANGNVGIGKIDPENKLDVNGTVRASRLFVDIGFVDGDYVRSSEISFIHNAANDRWVFGATGTGSSSDTFALAHVLGSGGVNGRAFVYDVSTNSFAINQRDANSAFNFYVNGAAGGTTGWTQSSDRRLKKDITPIANSLDKILKINGVGYNWRVDEFKEMSFDNKHQLGVIAQDIEAIIPEAVTVDDKGFFSVSYTTLIPVLVEAIKEQQTKIISKNKKLENLEQKQKEQQAEIEKLKKAVEVLMARK